MQSVTDAIGSLHWHTGRIAVGGETGWRLAGPARRQLWYRADLSTSLIRRLALVVGVDRGGNRHALVEAGADIVVSDLDELSVEVLDARFREAAEARARREELAQDPNRIYQILADGASRARKKAGEVLSRAQRACGVKR